jgi:hypothetical protein
MYRALLRSARRVDARWEPDGLAARGTVALAVECRAFPFGAEPASARGPPATD